ncbi:MAG: hypothetical protein JNL92_08740 [Opitutaceae bacterium]|nr:hypothetical protein [Opitutaceae bacterium]
MILFHDFRRALALAGLGLLSLAAPASAQDLVATGTLTFDHFAAPTGGVHMPAAYAGLRWDNSDWHAMSVASNPANTFLALSGTAATLAGEGGQNFYFDGAAFWSRRGLDANGSFYFYLMRDGVVVYDGRNDPNGRQVFDATPRRFVPNYYGSVDYVAIVFTQGGGDWDHLAMDDVKLRSLADGTLLRPFSLLTVPFSFSGSRTSTTFNAATGVYSATFSGKGDSSLAGRVSGTLTFSVDYRLQGGAAFVTGGRWSLVTTSRDRPPFTASGAIAAGPVLAANLNGTLAPGSIDVRMNFGDPTWPVSALFNLPMDAKGRVKGSYSLTYPYIP